MSLFPAFVSARKRKNETASRMEPAADSHQFDSRDSDADDNIFDLLPPESANVAAPKAKPESRSKHPVEMTDLSRLSIDNDGRLYWDGKPVDTHHRLSMSRAQVVGASIVAAFVVIGATASAIQGAVAARELACRLGWSASSCALPVSPPRPRLDIPA